MEQKEDTLTELLHQLHKLLYKERCYFDFKRITDRMLNKLNTLHDQETDPERKTHYQHAIHGLAHTIEKEVYYIKYHQDLMHKKNAPKVRADEYYKAISDAYDQIRLDIVMVLDYEKEESN